jgi:predicted ATP-grasp superfamily ATP-dependent carboligase
MILHGTTVLLTQGRLPKALELARSLHNAGCRVIIADPLRWHLCRPSRAVTASYQITAPNKDLKAYLEELLLIVTREQVRLIIPVAEESLHVAHLHDKLPENVTLLCPPRKQLMQLHHKLLFAHHARSLGLAVPPTFPDSSEAGLKLIEKGDYVAKPACGYSGMGVSICRNGQRHPQVEEAMLVQKYIEGDHVSSLTMFDRGRQIFTVIYRATVLNGTVAVCIQRVDYYQSVSTWIARYGRETKQDGLIGFDFIVDSSGRAWAIECNPRLTSGIHFIEPRSLARALLAPRKTRGVAYKAETLMQSAYMTLTETFAAILRPREFWRRLGQFLKARDVVWLLADPLPFLLMVPTSWEMVRPAIKTERTLLEIARADIAWLPNTATGSAAKPRKAVKPAVSNAPADEAAAPAAPPAPAPAEKLAENPAPAPAASASAEKLAESPQPAPAASASAEKLAESPAVE